MAVPGDAGSMIAFVPEGTRLTFGCI